MSGTFLERIRSNASEIDKHIVLPEGNDDRTLKAAAELVTKKICRVTILGNVDSVGTRAEAISVDLKGVTIQDPNKADQLEQFSETFFELRKHKGLTRDQALETVKKPLYWGALMVREAYADGSVAGADHTTGDVIRAGIQCIGLAENITTVSSDFIMVVPGWEQPISFADGAVVPDPNAEQMASIAIATAHTHQRLTGYEPVVAMLSFSTNGSAKHPLVDKVKEATLLVKEMAPDLKVDGELQLDSAIIPDIGKMKAPESEVAGHANVLIFPDLNAGNIGYKLTQRFGNAQAVGPVIQGLKKPANDLSRGCSVEDIVNVSAICCVLA